MIMEELNYVIRKFRRAGDLMVCDRNTCEKLEALFFFLIINAQDYVLFTV